MFFKLRREWQIILLSVFFGLILAIYIFGLLLDLEWFREAVHWPWYNTITSIKYTTTILCFVFLLLLLRGTKRDMYLALAFFFVLFADFFLVKNVYESGLHFFGVILFFVAQIFFMKRIHLNLNKSIKLIDYASRVFLVVIGLAIALPLLWDSFSFLFFVTIVYIANLVMNVIMAWVNGKKNILFALGVSLLLICDIFVGLQFQGPQWFNLWLPFDFAWLFYVPAKVLIVMSMFHKQTESESVLITKKI